MKTYKAICKKSSSKCDPNNELPNMFIQGEFYTVKKTNDPKLTEVTGKFGYPMGGTGIKTKNIQTSICKEHLVIVDGNEKLEYPTHVQRYNEKTNSYTTVKYEIYEEYKTKPIGTILHHDVGAPGIGHTKTIITRKDDKGIWSVTFENTVRIMDPSECE